MTIVLSSLYVSSLGLSPVSPSYRPQHSCGKIMFSEVCVKNSVHRGVCISACTGADTPPPSNTPRCKHPLVRHLLWSDTPWSEPLPRQTPPGQTPSGQTPLAQTPPTECMLGYIPPTATAADGAHPTGMYSCFRKPFKLLNFGPFLTYS